MEPAKFTKPSNGFSDMADFDLPIDAEFNALPPQVNLQEYCRLNGNFRQMFPESIPTEQERLARKFDEVFAF
jgi:hypothetical protein